MRLYKLVTKLLLPVFALAALLVLVVPDLPTAHADFSKIRAELDRGRLRIEGEGAASNAIITLDDISRDTADDRGRFRIELENFSSPSCQVTVSDGVTTQVVPLDPCDSPPAFAALEVGLLEEPLSVPPISHPSPVPSNHPVPADLPPGSLAEFVIEGVVSAIDGTQWQIGDSPVFVYQAATTRIDDSPKVDDLVRVIGVSTIVPGQPGQPDQTSHIVAERIRQRALGPLPVVPAAVELGFLFSGVLTSEADNVLTIGGIRFAVVELPEPTEIDPGVAEGSMVVVGFVEAAGLAPAP